MASAESQTAAARRRASQHQRLQGPTCRRAAAHSGRLPRSPMSTPIYCNVLNDATVQAAYYADPLCPHTASPASSARDKDTTGRPTFFFFSLHVCVCAPQARHPPAAVRCWARQPDIPRPCQTHAAIGLVHAPPDSAKRCCARSGLLHLSNTQVSSAAPPFVVWQGPGSRHSPLSRSLPAVQHVVDDEGRPRSAGGRENVECTLHPCVGRRSKEQRREGPRQAMPPGCSPTADQRRAASLRRWPCPAHVAAAGPAGMLPNHCAADLRRGGSLPQVKTWNASGGDCVCREPGERRMCRTSTCCDPTPTPKCRWPPGMRDMAARLCPVPFSAMLDPLPHAAAARRAHRCRFGPRVHLSPASRCCSGAIYANKRPSVSTLRRQTVCIASMPCLAPGPASGSPERLLVTFLTSPARPPPCSVEGSRNPPTMHGTCDS